jgi:hypothetical protein
LGIFALEGDSGWFGNFFYFDDVSFGFENWAEAWVFPDFTFAKNETGLDGWGLRTVIEFVHVSDFIESEELILEALSKGYLKEVVFASGCRFSFFLVDVCHLDGLIKFLVC